MTVLTTDLIMQACRIFFGLAYPAGEATIPELRKIFLRLPTGCELAALHAQSPFPAHSFKVFSDKNGEVRGYAMRLGSGHYPNLKLLVQWKEMPEGRIWVFSVDTHDSYSLTSKTAAPDNRDAEAWAHIQSENQKLKEKIEEAWEATGLMTFNAMLRQDLERATSLKQLI